MIKVFKSLIPEIACQKIIEEGLTRPQLDAGIGKNNTKSKGRSTSIGFINNAFIKSYIYDLVDANYNDYTIEDAEDLQFAEYNKGDFYGWHRDSNDTNKRIISVTVQLSDPSTYKGGNLVFEVDPLERAQGTVIIFPSNVRHQVTRVTEGTRYSLVQWFIGEINEKSI